MTRRYLIALADLHLSERATRARRLMTADRTVVEGDLPEVVNALERAQVENIAMAETIRSVLSTIAKAHRVAAELSGGDYELRTAVLGDLFDAKSPSPNELRAAGWLLFHMSTMTNDSDIPVLAGNHDVSSKLNDASAVWAMGARPRVRLFDSRGILDDFLGATWGVLPYPRRQSVRKEAPSLTNPTADQNTILSMGMNLIGRELEVAAHDHAQRSGQPVAALLTHVTIAGATVGLERTVRGDVELSHETCRAWPAVIAGHIHKHQILPNAGHAVYCGSPTMQDFGEIGDPHGGALFEVDDKGARLVRYVAYDGPAWHSFDVSDDGAGAVLEGIEPDSREVWRFRGECNGAMADEVNARVRQLASAGVAIFSEVRATRVNRLTDETATDELTDDAALVRKALVTREVPGGECDAVVELHREVAGA